MTLCCAPDSTDPGEGVSLGLPPGVPALSALYLYLSTSCNLACRHCWIAPRFVNGRAVEGDVLDLAALRGAIAEARPLGLRQAHLTGGEPLLHPGFLELLDLLEEQQLSVTMETNGTLVAPEAARRLADLRPRLVAVSIDGPDAGSHDAFRRVDGAFDAVVRGLDLLVAAGLPHVQVIMSVHRGNLEQVDSVLRLAVAHGARSLKLNPVVPVGRGSAMDGLGERLTFAERSELRRRVREELGPGAPIPVILEAPAALLPLPELARRRNALSDCGIRNVLGILGSGEIALCGMGRNSSDWVYGRLGVDSVREIWLHHPTVLALRSALDDPESYPGICGECVHASQCATGCVAHNYVDSRRLVWPNWQCTEADELGAFPPTRRRRRPERRDSALTSG